MASRLPPSSTAMRAFVTVARLGSTARAAGAVNLTQSAVSKQILSLEHHLGVPLFERHPLGLKLTEAGAIYLPYAEAALEQMERGAMRLAERAAIARPIRLHMVAIAGERWLIERFHLFAEAHPGVDVQFTNYVSESETEEPDIEINHGTPPWPGREAHYLIQKMTLLQHFQMPAFWAEFTEAHDLRGAVPAHTVRYGYYSVIIRAAVAGLGVALAPRCYVAEELASGALVNPLEIGFTSVTGCWLTRRLDLPPRPGLDEFIAWLKTEAAAFDTANRTA